MRDQLHYKLIQISLSGIRSGSESNAIVGQVEFRAEMPDEGIAQDHWLVGNFSYRRYADCPASVGPHL